MLWAPSFSWRAVPRLKVASSFNNDLQSQIAQPTCLWCHSRSFLSYWQVLCQLDSLFTDIMGSSKVLLFFFVWLVDVLKIYSCINALGILITESLPSMYTGIQGFVATNFYIVWAFIDIYPTPYPNPERHNWPPNSISSSNRYLNPICY